MSTLELPELALVVLVGVTGSGRPGFARRHFASAQVLSSETSPPQPPPSAASPSSPPPATMGSAQPTGSAAPSAASRSSASPPSAATGSAQPMGSAAPSAALPSAATLSTPSSVSTPPPATVSSASGGGLEPLRRAAAQRLAAGRLTVVDAANVRASDRETLISLAREHDVPAVAIVIDTPEAVCREQARRHPGSDAELLEREQRELRRSLGKLAREGFYQVHILRGSEDVTIRYRKPRNDRRDLSGPFDIVGDVHGCREELELLLTELGWRSTSDGWSHPAGRTAVFVGDLVDRGPDTPGVLRLVMGLIERGRALCVAGNHEAKLLRYLQGRKVRVGYGLAETIAQLERDPVPGLESFLDGLISHYVLDGGELVVAHAGLKERYHGRVSGRVRSFALYGDTTGETDEYGLPVRYPWANDYRGTAMVVYGHTPAATATWVNNTICLDTGAVFGGALTALRYPERELVSVPALREYYAPTRPLIDRG